MQQELHAEEGTEHGLPAGNPLRVAILHDGAEAGHHAMRRLRSVTSLFEPQVDLDVRLWRLDELADHLSAEAVADDLATADLLICSLGEEGSLDSFVRARLVEVLGRKQGQDAALAVLTARAIESEDKFDALRTAARKAGVQLLEPSGKQFSCAAIHNRATAITPVLEGIMNRPCRGGADEEARF